MEMPWLSQTRMGLGLVHFITGFYLWVSEWYLNFWFYLILHVFLCEWISFALQLLTEVMLFHWRYSPYCRWLVCHGFLGAAGKLHFPAYIGALVPFRAVDEWESSGASDERLGWSTRPGTAPTNKKPPWIERDRFRKSYILILVWLV